MAPGLHVVINGDPARLAQEAGSFLRTRPAEHSVLLTNLARALGGGTAQRPPGLPPDLWWWVASGDDVVAVLMQTPPHGAYLSTGPDAVMALLAETLHRARPLLPGVGGPGRGAQVFAEAWRDAGGPEASVGMRQGLFVADTVVEPAPIGGRHRLATAADLPTLQPWSVAFVREATPHGLADVDHVTGRVAAGLLHVWDVDGEPMSMAAVTPPESDVTRVQLVYTPPALRGNGFAAACVAAVTGGELAHAGRRCMLYTDLANPTSNALYERVGYRRVGEALDLVFAPSGRVR